MSCHWEPSHPFRTAGTHAEPVHRFKLPMPDDGLGLGEVETEELGLAEGELLGLSETEVDGLLEGDELGELD